MIALRSFCAVALLSLWTAPGFAASPYAGQQNRAIKALSDQEIADYLTGSGMGFAKAAELNGYPGPAHVLEHATELDLSAQQKARTQQVFERMQVRARALGVRLVDEERTLDALFSEKKIANASLEKALSSIATLQGELRLTHLQAHLEQRAILSEAQLAKYRRLRGYEAGHSAPSHRH